MLITMSAVVVAAAFILLVFFKTNLGTAIRATGDNPQMIRALGVDVDIMMILGLAISNGLIALAGALLAQYQGFADVQMGIGMMVWGLASVIIGEVLVGSNKQGLVVTGTIMGSVLFRLLVAIALRWGLNPNDLKLITALFVFAALVGPTVARSLVKKGGNQPSGRTV
jgi:putative ABC transport system permease protein